MAAASLKTEMTPSSHVFPDRGTTAGETGMMSGHWFPPHITSLAGYINYIVNVWHSYAVVSIKSTISLFILILSTCM